MIVEALAFVHGLYNASEAATANCTTILQGGASNVVGLWGKIT